ncbi:hypothetical protein JCM5353_004970 [Sporobolomyces roseus]
MSTTHPLSDDSTTQPTSNKRARLDSPSSSSNLISNFPHLFNTPTGLFNVLAPTLGKKPAEEPQVGITQFVDEESKSFSGIIKHRFTDFLVYEVGEDGKVVRLTDIKGPIQDKKQRNQKGKQQQQQQEGDKQGESRSEQVVKKPEEAPAPELPLWNDTISSSFEPLLTPAKLTEFSQFLLSGSPFLHPAPKPTKDTPGIPQLPTFESSPIEDKNLRGKFHQSIRQHFGGRLVSAHKEFEGGDVGIEVNWVKGNAGGGKKRGGGNGGGGRDRDRGDEQELRENRAEQKAKLDALPPYIIFTLLKTNKESHDALSTLSRYFNCTSRELGLAGTKDKRAITVQRVTLKRGKKGWTAEDVWRVARSGGGGRGGFVDRNVRIGDVGYSEKGLELGMLKGNKFVVTLRDIDPSSIPTIHSSVSSLASNGFLNYYGMQRFGTAPIPTHLIGLALLRSEWEFAVSLLMEPREGESQDVAVSRGLWKEGKRAEARKSMPRRCTAEKAVMDAYGRGNEKDHLGALSSIPKNLRLMYVHAWQSYIWNRLVSERVKLFGAKEPVEGDLVYVEEGAQEEEKQDEANEHGAETKEQGKTSDPSSAEAQQEFYISTSSLPKVRPLTASDINSKTHTIYDVLLPMPGFAVTYPGGELGEMYKRVIREDGIDPEKMWRKQKEYSLGGTYRKILHLPDHVSYKLLVSTSSQQDLAQSDEDVLLEEPALNIPEYDEETGLKEGESLNLQVELELGSSTYATMALREILKSRTSAANQKSLTKEMEGRLGTGAATNNGTEVVATTTEDSVEREKKADQAAEADQEGAKMQVE